MEEESNPVGRPTVMTGETIQKLEEGFLHGLNDREACLQANIVPQTLYNYCHENPEFFERKELLKDNTKMIAKNNIHAEIVKGDKSLSQWYLERKDKEFKPKQENDNTEKVIIHLTDYTAPGQK